MNREIRLLGGFRQTFGPGSILPILGSEFALKETWLGDATDCPSTSSLGESTDS
jgi:hypothetical protein